MSDEIVSADGAAAFEVELASSGAVYEIPADQSVYAVLESAGIDIPVGCEMGICGSCLTPVLSGIPHHRDQVLSDEERAQNNLFTPCCSRAMSKRLILDL